VRRLKNAHHYWLVLAIFLPVGGIAVAQGAWPSALMGVLALMAAIWLWPTYWLPKTCPVPDDHETRHRVVDGQCWTEPGR